MLDIANIHFGFSKAGVLLRDVSFKIRPGAVYVLMGGNGAGKTTLFNIISGFLRPWSGRLEFRSTQIQQRSPYQISRLGIGRTFQEMRMSKEQTVRQNVLLAMPNNPTDSLMNAILPTRFHRRVVQSMDKAADEILERFSLADVREQLAGEISYGQQKLLSLACCASTSARLLLLDEPGAGVQPVYQSAILDLLRDMRQHEAAFLIIEHDANFVENLADEVLFLHGGELSSFPDLDRLRASTVFRHTYLA